MILVECGLCLAFFVFCAIVCSLYVNHVAPAVLMLTPVFILAALFWITQKDMDKAYIARIPFVRWTIILELKKKSLSSFKT